METPRNCPHWVSTIKDTVNEKRREDIIICAIIDLEFFVIFCSLEDYLRVDIANMKIIKIKIKCSLIKIIFVFHIV